MSRAAARAEAAARIDDVLLRAGQLCRGLAFVVAALAVAAGMFPGL